MAEYMSPCMETACPYNPGDSDTLTRLCRGIGETIVEAGGVGLPEVDPCPMDALIHVGPESDNPQISELRQRIGIIGYHTETDLG